MVMIVACTAPTRFISFTARTRPVYTFNPAPEKILLLNNVDIVSKKYRDNKEELFIALTNEIMEWAGKRIAEKDNIPTEVIRGYTPLTDSTIRALLSSHHASHAIIIRSFDVFFYQTNVEVEKDQSGSKSRTAYYDIESDITYEFYNTAAMLKGMTIHRRRFHSSRSVLSGLLAAGPNIVAKRDDALTMAIDNFRDYLLYFFPGETQRNRQVFTGKEFPAVNAALAKYDFEAAMTESLRFIDDPNREKAAKALYNCAVLFERKDQPEEARSYLLRSLAIFDLPLARVMMGDYE
jgi:hypothetical protein